MSNDMSAVLAKNDSPLVAGCRTASRAPSELRVKEAERALDATQSYFLAEVLGFDACAISSVR